MFKFNFSDLDLEVSEADQQQDPVPSNAENQNSKVNESQPLPDTKEGDYMHKKLTIARELPIDQLAKSLPPALSYSPLVVPLTYDVQLNPAADTPKKDESTTLTTTDESIPKPKVKKRRGSITLLRRDLYDARYQLISETKETDTSTEQPGLDFVDNPSDLVPGVYEGGLKTWECSLDLVDCLSTIYPDTSKLRGKRIIEIGCGTAVPSLYLLRLLLSEPRPEEPLRTEIILQDYNDLVLQLVTFPNVLLTWYSSPLAESYRERRDADEELFDPHKAGDMPITPDLMSEFQASLESYGITIRFISGSWQSLIDEHPAQPILTYPFDVVLTSETIYNMDNLPILINLLKVTMGKLASGEATSEAIAEKLNNSLTLDDNETNGNQSPGSFCLVAAKVLYFGVGGSVIDFERAVVRERGKTEKILQREEGIKRTVLRLTWN